MYALVRISRLAKAQFILLRRNYAVASTPETVRRFSFIFLRRRPRQRAVHMRTASLQCPQACYCCNPQYHGKIRRSIIAVTAGNIYKIII